MIRTYGLFFVEFNSIEDVRIDVLSLEHGWLRSWSVQIASPGEARLLFNIVQVIHEQNKKAKLTVAQYG